MAQIRVSPMDSMAKVSLYLCAAAIFLTGSATGLQCYQCTITPPGMLSNQTARLCVNFDGSSKYVVDCPYSTMCMKQSFDLVLNNKERVIHGVLRDCASQKHDYQVYQGGMWHPATDVQEVYQEGCHLQDDKGERSLSTEYCYCRNHLCNAAPSTKGSDLNYHTDAMAVIMVFNAMKYIRSMR